MSIITRTVKQSAVFGEYVEFSAEGYKWTVVAQPHSKDSASWDVWMSGWKDGQGVEHEFLGSDMTRDEAEFFAETLMDGLIDRMRRKHGAK